MSTVDAVIYIALWLVAYRLTRLITLDSFPPLLAARRAIVYREGKDPNRPLAELLTCGHCVGVYVAAALTLAAWSLIDYPLIVWGALAGAVSITLDALD